MTLDSTRIVAGAGLLCSLLIIAYGISNVWQSRPPVPAVAPVVQSTAPAGVWAAQRTIPRGQRITQADLVLVPIHDSLPPNAVTKIDAAIGKIAINDIPAYALIISDHITNDPAKAGLAQTIPLGFRAVSLRTNDEIAVSNFVLPGDHVDIDLIVRENVLPKQSETQEKVDGNPSESRTLLQDVTVLTVGDTLTAAAPVAAAAEQTTGRKPDPPHSVTLALTPDQAAQLMLARSLGSLYLSLRNPSDLEVIQSDTTHLPQIRGVTPPPATAVVQGQRPIELITGNKSKIIYSTNPGDKR
jgi:pilus assembly protein CpaB